MGTFAFFRFQLELSAEKTGHKRKSDGFGVHHEGH
jgi:hypothetical protein